MSKDDASLALAAAQDLCVAQGNCTADEVAALTGIDIDAARAALVALVCRGQLVGRPGGIYARALVRDIRLPGSSYRGGFRPSLAALTGAR